MPIQAGTYKVRGKMENRSYYKPKYSARHLVRSINQQMSNRVKTELGFATTRAYAAEFGVATGMSNEIFNVLRSVGCEINDPRLRSKLTSLLLGFVKNDPDHPLGQRTLIGYNWQDSVRAFLNTCTRTPFTNVYPSSIKVKYTTPTRQNPSQGNLSLDIDTSTQNNEYLRTLGIKNVMYEVYTFMFTAKKYAPGLNAYVPTLVQRLGSFETFSGGEEWGSTLHLNTLRPHNREYMELPGQISLAVVVCNATRSGNPEDNHLKSLSSFTIVPIDRVDGMVSPTATSIAYIEYMGHRFLNGDNAFVMNQSADRYIDVHFNVADIEPLSNPIAKINGNSASMVQLTSDLIRVSIGNLQDGFPLNTLGFNSGTNSYSIELFNNSLKY